MLSHIFRITLALLFCCGCAFAQSVGGYAGSTLRRSVLAQEIGMAGAWMETASPDAAAVFSNAAALERLEGKSIYIAASSPLFGQQTALLGFAMRLESGLGIGIGITSYSVGDILWRGVDGNNLGVIASQDLSVVLAGGLGIGPAGIGADIRIINRDLSGGDGGASGYALDVSGTMTFEENIFFSVALNNIAGEMSGSYDNAPREAIPFEARFGAAYMYPLHRPASSAQRTDPTGLPSGTPKRPDSYIMLATNTRILSAGDSPITFCGAIEAVPVAGLDLGFRVGANSLGDITGGFFYSFPTSFADKLKLDYSVRRDYSVGDITHHVGFTVGF